MDTIVYETLSPLRHGERFIAWLLQDCAVTKDRKPTGETKTVFMPVYFFGESAQIARDKALAFWDDGRAKKEALKERGKALSTRKQTTT